MQKTRNHKSSQTHMISRALNRPATFGDVTFEKIDDTRSSNPCHFSLEEQLRRMQWLVIMAAQKLGASASPEEYEAFLNWALPKIGVCNTRAVVEMNDEEP